MRLIIKDHLLRLKEKDELDLVLCDLLLQMGYITDNRPKTGNRQYGVDIRAHNDREILLLVVKQGNLNRINWDADQNAVRQSLDEIRDCYLEIMINDHDRKKRFRIVVATNGIMDEAVQPNWTGYISQNSTWRNLSLVIEFWNIDTITYYVQNNLFDEHIFSMDMQGLLRRALYYVEESDYRNEYYEQIIDAFIDQLNDHDNKRVRDKKLSGMFLASQMIAHYAANAGVFKIGIRVSEYLIIRYWKYLLEHDKMAKENYIKWMHQFLYSYEKWNQKYFDSVKYCCGGENRFPIYDLVEQKALLYEMMSYLVSYGYYLAHKYHIIESKDYMIFHERYHEVCNSIVQLINHNPQVYYPAFDCHGGILSMLFRLLDHFKRTEDILTLLHHQSIWLSYFFLHYHKYPSPVDSFEDAINIEMCFPSEEYTTSAFWGTVLEWISILDQKELYQKLFDFLKIDLEDVTNCVWFLRAEEESKFYDALAMNLSGEGVSFDIDKSYEKFKDEIDFIMKQYDQEIFSYEEYSFPALEFIVCRYYGYLVRVKREQ